jgi:hypothetical protein
MSRNPLVPLKKDTHGGSPLGPTEQSMKAAPHDGG